MRANTRRTLLQVGCFCYLGAVAGIAMAASISSAPAVAVGATANSSAPAGADKHWAFLNQYCSKCHNAEDWAGGVAFDTMTPSDIPQDAKVWEQAIMKLRGRLMPPAGNPQPPTPQTHEFVTYMEDTLDNAAEHEVDAPRVVLHRMNRTEYSNAVWDILKVRVDPAKILPPDDQAEGFNNVADVLQVSPAFIDAYISAARQVAVEALGDASAKPIGVQFGVNPATSGSQELPEEGLPLGTRGGTVVTYDFPADGDYELNIGNLAAALWVTNMEFDNHLIALLDGKRFFDTHIGGEEDLKSIDQKQDPAVEAINSRLKHIKFHATAGPHSLAVTFVHRSYAESEDRLEAPIPGGAQDRVLRLGGFEVKGPYNTTGISQTPSRKQILTCIPKTQAEEAPCAKAIFTTLAQKAFRRPVTDTDLAPLLAFYERGAKDGGFEAGIRLGLTALLASPNFLYRTERAATPLQAANSH